MVTTRYAVLVVNSRDADHKCPKQEREQLARLRAHDRLPPALAGCIAYTKGLGQQLGEGDEDEGPGADQQHYGDVLPGHRVPQREDHDRADDGGEGGQKVVGEGLLRRIVTARGMKQSAGEDGSTRAMTVTGYIGEFN